MVSLQVLTKSGECVPVTPLEGSVVCFVGDVLQRWSSDRFLSVVCYKEGFDNDYALSIFTILPVITIHLNPGARKWISDSTFSNTQIYIYTIYIQYIYTLLSWEEVQEH